MEKEPIIKTFKPTTVVKKLFCPNCNTEMKMDDNILLTNPPQYNYVCYSCNNSTVLTSAYPEVIYEDEIESYSITLEQWVEKYNPEMEDGQEIFYETYGEHFEELRKKASELAEKKGTRPYQHIWSRVDGDNGKLILLNGWHIVNRLDYCITEEPWGNGINADKNIYIEVKYEE
jgi:transcription elongation factor Elf1